MKYTDCFFSPASLRGSVRVPSSKSAGHRALICAALAQGDSLLYGIDLNDDIIATIRVLTAFGAHIDATGECIKVGGISDVPVGPVYVDCGESGSTLRFLIPVAAALGIDATFVGQGRLPERPIDEYVRLFKDKGVDVSLTGGKLPLHLNGKLKSGVFEVAGNITSQYISGLLFALPLLSGDSEIVLTSALESVPYVDMSIEALHHFLVSAQKTGGGYFVLGGQSYMPTTVTVEGDFSQAAFFAAAAAIGGEVEIYGLSSFTAQGDFAVVELLNRFGAKCCFDGTTLKVSRNKLCGIDINGLQIPDILPVLSVVAAYAEGDTRIYNAARLRMKESDRLSSTCAMIRAVGGDAVETDDGLIIHGKEGLTGGYVRSFGDHRIAMSAAVAAVGSEKGVTVDDMSCISKSYPKFMDDYFAITHKNDKK